MELEVRSICMGACVCVCAPRQLISAYLLCVCVHRVEKLPPSGPDFNAIENVWSFLDKRLEATDPGKLEKLADFKARVGNAVRWLNANGERGLHAAASPVPEG